MSPGATLICTRSHLTARGIYNYLQVVLPTVQVEIFRSMGELLKEKKTEAPVIFVQPDLLPTPHVYSLDKIRSSFPGCTIVAVANYELTNIVAPYFNNVIYFKDEDEEIIHKLKEIYQPVTSSSAKISDSLAISDRETEILRLVALGRTNKEISDELSISTHTVITHRKNITAKLGIKTIAGLTVYAILNNIILAEEVNNGVQKGEMKQ